MHPFQTLRPLVLASGSPRRREMLATLGLDFLVAAGGAEPDPEPGEDPAAYACRAALAKAAAVQGQFPGAVILAADTVVALDGHILGKPKDAADALATLARLAGREHLVVTGCALLADGRKRVFGVASAVRMAPADPQALAAYAACGEPLDKAGSYAVQGAGGFLVQGVTGSVSNVVGLPLAETVAALRELGAIAPAIAPAIAKEGTHG